MSRPAANQAAAARAYTSLSLAALDHHPLPCHNNPAVLSDDIDTRLDAANALCPDCPVLAACRTAGAFEDFGIWGGIDRTSHPKKSGGR